MNVAFILFAMTGLGGLTLAAVRLSGVPRPPTWIALGHGAVGATGLGWLTYVWMDTGLPELARAALGVFVLAAMGGFTLFLGFHLRSKPLPIWMVLGHGLVAFMGVVLLAMARFGGS